MKITKRQLRKMIREAGGLSPQDIPTQADYDEMNLRGDHERDARKDRRAEELTDLPPGVPEESLRMLGQYDDVKWDEDGLPYRWDEKGNYVDLAHLMEGKVKITKRQIRKIIKEEVTKILREQPVNDPYEDEDEDEYEPEIETVEITEPGVTPAAIMSAWPDGVLYKGQKVYDMIYGNNEVMNAAEEYMWDKAGGDENEGSDPEFQEAYLGYSPADHEFIMGFDIWPDERDEEGWSVEGGMIGGFVALNPDKLWPVGARTGGSGMYPSFHDEIKRLYPDIIDLRLD